MLPRPMSVAMIHFRDAAGAVEMRRLGHFGTVGVEATTERAARCRHRVLSVRCATTPLGSVLQQNVEILSSRPRLVTEPTSTRRCGTERVDELTHEVAAVR